jgi:glycosyltransferase involved in cell wall biosynthesis
VSAATDRRLLTIGMAVYGDITFDSRVRREAATLVEAGYAVTLICLDDAPDATDLPPGVTVRVHRPDASSVLPRSDSPFLGPVGGRVGGALRRGRWLHDYVVNLRAWGRWSAGQFADQVDVWHLHDLPALAAIGPQVMRLTPIVYDTHELFLETGSARRLPRPLWTLLRAQERRLARRAFAVVTVNDSLAEVLERRYHLRRIVVVHNCPDRSPIPSAPSSAIRRATGIPEGEPVILYHGNLAAHRGIEQLIEAIRAPGLRQVHLVLLGFGQGTETYRQAAADPALAGRVHLLPAVAPQELQAWIASADVEGMPIQASTLNHYLSTPNKLFEALAAGVPVVASDFPAMRRIVMDDVRGSVGAVCDPADVAALTSALRSILELDPAAAKALRARCLATAHDRWNWQIESVGLLRLYSEIAARG